MGIAARRDVACTSQILVGDALERLRQLPDASVQCAVTSPPYYALRDYGEAGQIGLEATPELFIERVTEVLESVRRVLRPDGVLWLVVGDTYCNDAHGPRGFESSGLTNRGQYQQEANPPRVKKGYRVSELNLKKKDLMGIPWRLAFALQDAGWWLRCDVVWHKPCVMPESVTDRPTKAHEYVFLLTKSAQYYYDAESIKEEVTGNAHSRGDGVNPKAKIPGPNSRVFIDRVPKPRKQNPSVSAAVVGLVEKRNRRSVWTVAAQPYSEAHFATFPPDLVEPCILAGSRVGDTVLDPFCGAGTTGLVAARLRRSFIGIELNPEYAAMTERRIREDAPLLNRVEVDP